MRTTKAQISLCIHRSDLRLCFGCFDSIISLVSLCAISSLVSETEQTVWSQLWSQTPKTGFFVTRLNCNRSLYLLVLCSHDHSHGFKERRQLNILSNLIALLFFMQTCQYIFLTQTCEYPLKNRRALPTVLWESAVTRVAGVTESTHFSDYRTTYIFTFLSPIFMSLSARHDLLH